MTARLTSGSTSQRAVDGLAQTGSDWLRLAVEGITRRLGVSFATAHMTLAGDDVDGVYLAYVEDELP